jgi:hypothetical protein
MAGSQTPDSFGLDDGRWKGTTMLDFWTSIPLMALAAVVSLATLLVLSVTDHRRPRPLPLRVRGEQNAAPPATDGGPTP